MRLRAGTPAHPDEELWSAARDDGRGALTRALRASATVGVCGLGRTGLLLARSLVACGVGTVVLDDDLEVDARDVGPGAYDLRDVGASRRSAAARLLHGHGGRVSLGERTDLDAVVVVTGGPLDAARTWRLMGHGIPHLSVAWEGATVTVGPLVVPGLTACLRCVDLHRTDDTPRTPRRPPPAWHGRHAEETVLTLVAAGTAVRAVTTLVDGRGVSIATTERFTAARPAPQVEHWPPHPAGRRTPRDDRPTTASRDDHVDLAGASPSALGGDHAAVHEDLTAPDAPRFGTLDRAGQAAGHERALAAHGLGLLDRCGLLGEPELGVVVAARQQAGDEQRELPPLGLGGGLRCGGRRLRGARVGGRGAGQAAGGDRSGLRVDVEQHAEPHDVLQRCSCAAMERIRARLCRTSGHRMRVRRHDPPAGT
jgi:hypothetical protein